MVPGIQNVRISPWTLPTEGATGWFMMSPFTVNVKLSTITSKSLSCSTRTFLLQPTNFWHLALNLPILIIPLQLIVDCLLSLDDSTTQFIIQFIFIFLNIIFVEYKKWIIVSTGINLPRVHEIDALTLTTKHGVIFDVRHFGEVSQPILSCPCPSRNNIETSLLIDLINHSFTVDGSIRC